MLMRTLSPTLYFHLYDFGFCGYSRFRTTSSLSTFTSTGAIPIERWCVLLYESIKSGNTSTYRLVLLVGEITKHFRLQCPIETFHHCSLNILVFASLKLYAAPSQHRLKSRIHKLRPFVTLHHVTFLFGQYLFECLHNVSAGLCSYRHGPSSLAKHVYAGKYISHSVVV